MMYLVTYIELDGTTKTANFKNKKSTQSFIWAIPYNPIEKVEKVTKKETRDVTELFEIEYLADSAESVEPEKHRFEIDSKIERLRNEIVNDIENISGGEALIDILVGLKDSDIFKITAQSIRSWRKFYTKCIEENEQNIQKIRNEPFSGLHQNLLIIEYKWHRKNKKALYLLNEIETLYLEMKGEI